MASGSHLGNGIPLMRSGSSKSTKPTNLRGDHEIGVLVARAEGREEHLAPARLEPRLDRVDRFPLNSRSM